MQDKVEKIWAFREWEKRKYAKWRCERLKNKDFTIISSDCIASIIYHDLGIPFLSPTINLTIGLGDFVRFVENLKWYMEQELIEFEEEGAYPTGVLGDIKIGFVHYENFEDAKEKWEKRKKRINWKNLFFIGAEKKDCTYEILQRFECLPYQNKVFFTRIEYPEISSSYYIKGFEEKNELGNILALKNQLLIRRYIDDFDYVAFLNDGIIGPERKYSLL